MVEGITTKVISTLVLAGVGIWGIQYALNGEARDQKNLLKKKVKFDLNNIPSYTIEEVKIYAGMAERGELYSWGGTQYFPIELYNEMIEARAKVVRWTPSGLVEDLYKAMKGASFINPATSLVSTLFMGIYPQISKVIGDTPKERAWNRVLKLNKDQLRFLHNYWIDNASEGDSFFDWVSAEWDNTETQKKVISKLTAAGVGEYVNKKG